MSNKDLLVFLGACYVAGAVALLLNLEEFKHLQYSQMCSDYCGAIL
jgi:hypothetical protein